MKGDIYVATAFATDKYGDEEINTVVTAGTNYKLVKSVLEAFIIPSHLDGQRRKDIETFRRGMSILNENIEFEL
jgi:hypothetical protein